MYQKSVLANGIRIVTEKVPESHLISLGIWIQVGSRDETLQNNGYAHFLEHMLFKGTEKRSARQIGLELDMLGGMSNAFTSTEATCFYATVLNKHLEKIVDLFSDLFLNSRFDDSEIERERQVILQEINMVEDTPDDQVHDYFSSLLWGDHPIGHTVLGSKENVGTMDSAKLREFFNRFYIPDNMLIVASGNIDHDQFCKLWEDYFSLAPSGQPLLSSARTSPVYLPPRNKVYSKALEQAHMVVGTYGLPVQAEQRYALHLLNTLLGGNMSSRLFQEIREKRGLSYSVYSSLSSFMDSGQISIYLGLDRGAVNEALSVINREIERLKTETVSVEELQCVKDYVATGLFLTGENMESRMMQLAKHELYFGRYVDTEELLAGIEAVQPVELVQLAGRLFAGPLAGVVLGPIDETEIAWRQMAAA